MIPEPHLKALLAGLLRLRLPSYTWERNHSPGGFPFLEADFYGEAKSGGKALKRIVIQVEPLLDRPALQTHAEIRGELLKRRLLGRKDEYWIVIGGRAAAGLKQSAALSHIILRDISWIKSQLARYRKDSRKLRQIEQSILMAQHKPA